MLILPTLVIVTCPLEAQPQTVGLFLNDSASFNGYTLFAPMHFRTTYLINNNGELCHSWQSNWMPGRSVALLENGNLLRACFMAPVPNPYFPGGGEGGRAEEYDWDGNMVWAFNYNDSMHLQHHEITPLSNGNVLMIAYDRMLYNQAIAAGRRPDRLIDSVIWPDHIIEVQKTGETTGTIVWEWHVWDHLIQDYDSTKANYGNVGQHPELIDLNYGPAQACWNHTNSINYNAEFDQILLSVRGNSEIWIIDHSTTTEQARGHTGGRSGKGGDLLYRWGNPQAYHAGNNTNQKLFQQHDARWIPAGCPGAGNMLIFNNGLGRGYSSVDEIVPPVDSMGNYYLPPGGRYGPEHPVWIYQASPETSFFSPEISGAQRLPNGNTLICAGVFGNFFEIAPDTSMVWCYVNPVINSGPLYQGDTIPNDPHRPGQKMNAVFKINRFAPDYPGLVGRNLEPQGPIERYHTGVDKENNSLNHRCPVVMSQSRGDVTFSNLPEQGIIEIYSVTGRLVRRSVFARHGKSLCWDLRTLCRITSGVYICRIKDHANKVITSSKFTIVQ